MQTKEKDVADGPELTILCKYSFSNLRQTPAVITWQSRSMLALPPIVPDSLAEKKRVQTLLREVQQVWGQSGIGHPDREHPSPVLFQDTNAPMCIMVKYHSHV